MSVDVPYYVRLLLLRVDPPLLLRQAQEVHRHRHTGNRVTASTKSAYSAQLLFIRRYLRRGKRTSSTDSFISKGISVFFLHLPCLNLRFLNVNWILYD